MTALPVITQTVSSAGVWGFGERGFAPSLPGVVGSGGGICKTGCDCPSGFTHLRSLPVSQSAARPAGAGVQALVGD